MYRKPEAHPHLSARELAYIQSDPPDTAPHLPWLRLIPHRQTCAFAIGKYMTDPVWWLYLFWIPNFLRDKHKLDLSTVGPPLIAIYLIADVGSVGGGWLSSAFIKRGWTINRARKTTMLICALAVTPIVFLSQVTNLWGAVALIGLATAAHQGWSANIFTTVSDMFPRRAVGSVVGIGGMAGAMGGATMAVATGYLLDRTGGNYMIIFFIAGSLYLAALGVIHLLVPKLQPLDEAQAMTIKPISVGSIVGFGFIGMVLGTLCGWITGLLVKAAGSALLGYLMTGSGIGLVIGAASGVILCSYLSKASRG
jgi:ACS family hexuronate transporter-like MFS transporter